MNRLLPFFFFALTEAVSYLFKVGRYLYAVAVWIDWTAIALVSTKSRTGLIKIAVAPCESECLASFSRHSAVSPGLLAEVEGPLDSWCCKHYLVRNQNLQISSLRRFGCYQAHAR